MCRILWILLLSVLSVVMYAQSDVVVIDDLDQAIALAIDNNAALKAIRRQQEQTVLRQGTAGDIGKTSVYHSYDANNLAPNDRALRVFGVYQTVPFPTVFSEKERLYRIQAEKALLNYDLERWKLEKEVSQAWYECVLRKDKLRLYTYLDSIFSAFSEAAATRYEVGETTYLEKITAKNHYQQQLLKRRQGEEELKIAYDRLKGLLQLDQDLVVTEASLKKTDRMLPSSGQSPVHKILNIQVNEMDAQWRVMKSQTMPDISIEYFRGFGIGENSRNFDGYMIGLEIPLWVKPFHKNHQVMKMEVEKAGYTRLDYEKRFSARYAELKALLGKYERSIAYFENEGLPAADEIRQVALQSYYAGEIDYMDYIRSLETATQTSIQYLEDLNRYNQTFISLYYLTDIKD